MARQGAKPYVFVGTERELVDPQRYEGALRAWTGYLLQSIVDEQLKRRRQGAKVG